VVPENIHTPPTEGRWKFRGGGGVKGRNFRGKGGGHIEPLFPEGVNTTIVRNERILT